MSRKRPQPPVKPFKKKPNPLKAARITEIDYKDVALLLVHSIAARFVPVVLPASPFRTAQDRDRDQERSRDGSAAAPASGR